MRNVINYFYDLYITDINEYENYSIILCEEKIYILKKIINGEQMQNFIINATNINNNLHKLILNNRGNYITSVNSSDYVLMEVSRISKVVNSNFEFVFLDKEKDDIPDFWSKKIDYYMKEIRNVGVGKALLVDSFNYYIGLGENAISIYNRTLATEGILRYTLSHRRITYPNYGINYYDPTNMLIDTISRDISEYIKYKIVNDKINVKEIIKLIEKYKLTDKEINIMYSRILFPSYFFDELEKSVSGNYNAEIIQKILNSRLELEKILRELYLNIKKSHQLYVVDWLIYKDL